MKSPFGKKKKLNEEMSLQITSMADIFTIILVFLLKSYSTSLTNLSPAGNIALPVGQSEAKIKETLKMEITRDYIMIDTKPVVTLKNFQFTDIANPNLPASTAVTPPAAVAEGSEEIFKVLSQQRKLLPEPNMDSTLIVLADEGTPYSTLKRVLASAASTGFVDLQLVVVKPE